MTQRSLSPLHYIYPSPTSREGAQHSHILIRTHFYLTHICLHQILDPKSICEPLWELFQSQDRSSPSPPLNPSYLRFEQVLSIPRDLVTLGGWRLLGGRSLRRGIKPLWLHPEKFVRVWKPPQRLTTSGWETPSWCYLKGRIGWAFVALVCLRGNIRPSNGDVGSLQGSEHRDTSSSILEFRLFLTLTLYLC